MQKKFELKKINEDKYKYIGHHPLDDKGRCLVREETVDKKFIKDHYKATLEHKQQQLNNLAQIQKSLEENHVDKSEEMEHFIEMANYAAKFKKFQDAQANKDATMNILKMLNEEIEIFEKAIPELKRAKK
jgi:hypothetical protein